MTIPAYAIPPIVYGKSDMTSLSGTLTLSGDTLLHTLLEIAESLYRAGFRKLLMINGHGGQPQILADRLPGNAPAPRGFHRHPPRRVQRAQLRKTVSQPA